MIIMGDFPQPMHGMAQVNQFMYELLLRNKTNIQLLNTAPSYAYSKTNRVSWSIVKFLHRLFCSVRLIYILCINNSPVVYRAINGGYGQVYDLLYIFISRLFQREIFIHHHSYAYLSKKSNLFSFLVFISGRKVRHIVLASGMKKRMAELYAVDPELIFVISNLSFFSNTKDISHRKFEKIILGHMSNLSFEKGVGTFVDLCHSLKDKGIPFEAIIAGPFTDQFSERVVTEAQQNIPELQYIGPVYEAEKADFFSKINVFVFPSEYNNEAEPLVLYEAAQYGVYIVGSQVGCLKDMIASLEGMSYGESTDMIEGFNLVIDNNDFLKNFSENATDERISLFNSMRYQSIKKRDGIVDIMMRTDNKP